MGEDNLNTLLLVLTILGSSFVNSQQISNNQSVNFNNDYVSEIFYITSVNGDEIRGELLVGTGFTGEGIYLLKSELVNYNVKPTRDIKVGDRVRVTYDAADYYNENWDSILGVEIVNGGNLK